VLIPTVLFMLCAAMLLPLKDQSPASDPADIPPDSLARDPHQGDYVGLCYTARIALFSSWFGAAILRSQFALLLTDLGFAESQFGMIIALGAASNLMVFWMAGRWASWHGRTLPLILTQVLIVLCMVFFIQGRSMAVFSLGAILHGSGQGFAYSAHLYYSAAGPSSRSKSMVVHELTIAISTVIGSALGGYVSHFGGVYWPYWLCLWLACVSVLAQAGIWARRVPKMPKVS
jgi:MFS family permease